jgi:hypothetical protein
MKEYIYARSLTLSLGAKLGQVGGVGRVPPRLCFRTPHPTQPRQTENRRALTALLVGGSEANDLSFEHETTVPHRIPELQGRLALILDSHI